MDEAVIRYYRQLLKDDFPHAGEIECPTIFVEAVGEKLIHCGNTGNYMQLYFRVADSRIADLRYLCSCEPAANVAVEVLCTLARGKTLPEAAALEEEAFYQVVGSREEEFAKKVRGILALFSEGIAGCQGSDGGPGPGGTGGKDGRVVADGFTWDRSYSP